MLLSDIICDRYVFLKYEYGKLQFWSEDACGYVNDIENAGVFKKEDINKFGLRYFKGSEIKKNLYKKNIHFAVSFKNAIKYFMY